MKSFVLLLLAVVLAIVLTTNNCAACDPRMQMSMSAGWNTMPMYQQQQYRMTPMMPYATSGMYQQPMMMASRPMAMMPMQMTVQQQRAILPTNRGTITTMSTPMGTMQMRSGGGNFMARAGGVCAT